MTRAALGKPAPSRTESAVPSGNKMRLVRAPLGAPGAAQLSSLRGWRDDDFPDMAGLLHEPHRVDEIARLNVRYGKGENSASAISSITCRTIPRPLSGCASVSYQHE